MSDHLRTKLPLCPPSEQNSTSYVQNGLDDDTSYDFQLRACTDGASPECSDWSEASSGTTLPEVPPTPPVPAITSVGSATTNSLTVNWDDVDGETRYEVEYKASSSSTWQTGSTNIEQNSTSYVQNGLNDDTSYDFQLRACTDGASPECSDWSEPGTAATSPLPSTPSVPTITSATPLSTYRMDVEWEDVDGETRYELQYKESDANQWLIESSEIFANATSEVVIGLEPGTSYDFQLRACAAGASRECSNWSQPVSGTTLEGFYLAVTMTGSGWASSRPGGIYVSTDEPSDLHSFPTNEDVRLFAYASDGWHIAAWGGACDQVSPETEACTIRMNAAKNASVTFEVDRSHYSLSATKTGSGEVTSVPPGIYIPTSGTSATNDFPARSDVTVDADADPGWQITSWGGDCDEVLPTSTQCVVEMNLDKSVSVVFERIPYTLSVSSTGSGEVSSTPPGIYISSSGGSDALAFPYETPVKLEADPVPGWRVKDWGGECDAVPATSLECSVTMNNNVSVSIEFERIPYTLSVTATGNGDVSSEPPGIYITGSGGVGTHAFPYQTPVTLEADPVPGWRVKDWGGECNAVPATSFECSVTMNNNVSASVEFERVYTLSVTKEGNGTVNSTPPGISIANSEYSVSHDFPAQSDVSLQADADANNGWRIKDWGGACNAIPASSEECVLTMNSNLSVSVTFEQTFTLSVSKTGTGTVVSDPPGIDLSSSQSFGTATYGDWQLVQLTATVPEQLYVPVWGGDCQSGVNDISCFVQMNSNKSITLGFQNLLDVCSIRTLGFPSQSASTPYSADGFRAYWPSGAPDGCGDDPLVTITPSSSMPKPYIFWVTASGVLEERLYLSGSGTLNSTTWPSVGGTRNGAYYSGASLNNAIGASVNSGGSYLISVITPCGGLISEGQEVSETLASSNACLGSTWKRVYVFNNYGESNITVDVDPLLSASGDVCLGAASWAGSSVTVSDYSCVNAVTETFFWQVPEFNGTQLNTADELGLLFVTVRMSTSSITPTYTIKVDLY